MKFVVNQWKLRANEDAQIILHLLEEDGTPIQITGASGYTLRIKNADGSVLSKAPYSAIATSFGPCPIYIAAFQLSGAEVAALPITAGQTVELEVDFGTPKRFVFYRNCLTVVNDSI